MTSNKPICKYGAACYRKNPDHLRQFAHPDKEEKVEGAGREPKTVTAQKPEVQAVTDVQAVTLS